MKKIFIGLLAAAAITSIAFYCTSGTASKELIVGKWQMDSIDVSKVKDSSLWMLTLAFLAEDSNASKIQFDFHSNGWITDQDLFEGDTDSSRYEWESAHTIRIAEGDPTKEKWSIQQLDTRKLVIVTEDSLTFFMSRIK